MPKHTCLDIYRYLLIFVGSIKIYISLALKFPAILWRDDCFGPREKTVLLDSSKIVFFSNFENRVLLFWLAVLQCTTQRGIW